MQGARILYEAGQPAGSASFGKYELIELIGHGGMAEVWKARMIGPAGFNRTVVVKRILPHLAQDPQFSKMFLTEARLSARLTHPNIVQVFELGERAGQYFLSMEYVRGRDLLQVLRMLQRSRGGPPPIELGTVVVRDVCRALGYAHALTTEEGAPLKIIHRDVTPSNVMVAYEGSAKLLDFGIAKAFGSAAGESTRAGELKGKFAYMAPEQLEPHHPVDHRADIFAAGVVLWEALTGVRLFKGDNDVETLHLVREAKVAPPSSKNPAVTPELDRICAHALMRKPEERYANAEEMAIDLDKVAHQMSAGAEGVKAVLRTLFPNEGSGQVSVTETNVPPSSSIYIGTLPPTPRRKLGLVLSLVLVAGAAVAGWLVVSDHMGAANRGVAHAASGATSAPAAATPVAATPSAEAAPAKPATISVLVHSTPARAEIFIDDDPVSRGRTPTTLTLPRSHDMHQLTLKLPGYPPKMIPLRADNDARVELALVQAPAPPPPVVAQPVAAPARPAPTVGKGAPKRAPEARKPAKAPGDKPAKAPGDKPSRVNDADGEDVLDPFR